MTRFDGLERLRRLSRWLRIALAVYIVVMVLAMIGGGFLVYWQRTANFTQPGVTFSVLLNFRGNAVLSVATLMGQVIAIFLQVGDDESYIAERSHLHFRRVAMPWGAFSQQPLKFFATHCFASFCARAI